MSWIGLTGGIASGKSTVARRLAELGAVVIDADRVAREVVEPGTPALARIEEEFGSGVIAADGSLDRPALGAIVFGDAEKLALLNAITHPAVGRRTTELRDAARAADPDAVIVYDVPLLVEGLNSEIYGFDEILVVQADAAERRRRLVELRGMDPGEADRRIAAQATDEQRLAVADRVIRSDGTLPETLDQVDSIWASLTSG